MKKNSSCNCGQCRHKLCTQRVPIFSGLDPEELGQVASLIKHRKYEKGEMILHEGNRQENLIIVNQGRVKAFKYTPDGKEQILYMFSQGDFFGERNLLKNREAAYHVQALDDTELCMIHQQDFQQLLGTYPGIGFKIIEELCSRMEQLEDAVQNMGTKSIEARINGVLAEFAAKYGKQHPRGILVELPLSREGIASYIGTARETVSRKLSILQEEGVIEAVGNKKIIIRDMKGLE